MGNTSLLLIAWKGTTMDAEEERQINVYSERVAKVETQMAYVLVEQSNFRTLLDRQNALIETVTKQINSQEYQTRAIIDRTDTHSKEIERLQSEQVDTGKVLAAIGVQINLVKYIGGGLVTLIIGYLFSHFIK